MMPAGVKSDTVCRICAQPYVYHERRCRHVEFRRGKIRRCIKDAGDARRGDFYCEGHARH